MSGCNLQTNCINSILCRMGPGAKNITSMSGRSEDGRYYTAYLLGINEENSSFYYEITLAIESGSCCMGIKLSDFAGYEPKINLLDFTGDSGDDIYITIASGGSGGYEFFNIFTFRNCILTKLLSSEDFNQMSHNTAPCIWMAVRLLSCLMMALHFI